LAIIVQFLTKTQPTFAANDLYIGGEGYAGVIIPYVANAIATHNSGITPADQLHLKGILLGNPFTNLYYDGLFSTIKMLGQHAVYSP